ncbi:hypothetical protein [Glutamicibacter sp. 2E12]|uniref:hypothetical protein n=1 Tax=Glutamicibacter sp. 2E12 TaxID=3416181 RepID=UPI003CF497F4
MSANELTSRYEEEIEYLKSGLVVWQSNLEQLAKSVDPNVHVDGRYKKLPSLLAKAYKKNPTNPRQWDTFHDLVALKAIFPTQSGAREFTDLLESHAKENNFYCHLDRRRPEPDKLEYSADQFDLSDPKILDSRGDALKIEVQVRTAVSDAWYIIDHRLNYKNPTDLPDNLQRRVLRLIALAELFDEEVSSLISDVSNYEERVESGKFNKVNELFRSLTKNYSTPARPEGLFFTLLQGYSEDDRENIESALKSHLEESGLGDHYMSVVELHSPGAVDFVEQYDWLYMQPESLLIADLAQQPRRLAALIENSDFERIVTSMANDLKLPKQSF